MSIRVKSLIAAASLACLTSGVRAAQEMSIGNGDTNWIVQDGASRNGNTLIFPEVQIDGNGWLVLHPFENGKPNGKIYVGHSYVASGSNKNVAITVDKGIKPGDMFIVMLHRDVDEDKVFDFIFVDDTHVEDKAVFEGSKMIAHVYTAP